MDAASTTSVSGKC